MSGDPVAFSNTSAVDICSCVYLITCQALHSPTFRPHLQPESLYDLGPFYALDNKIEYLRLDNGHFITGGGTHNNHSSHANIHSSVPAHANTHSSAPVHVNSNTSPQHVSSAGGSVLGTSEISKIETPVANDFVGDLPDAATTLSTKIVTDLTDKPKLK